MCSQSRVRRNCLYLNDCNDCVFEPNECKGPGKSDGNPKWLNELRERLEKETGERTDYMKRVEQTTTSVNCWRIWRWEEGKGMGRREEGKKVESGWWREAEW